MQPNFLGLRTTIYKVADMQKATAWYSAIMGIAPYFDEPFYVGFNVAGYELGLQPEDTSTISKPASVVTYWGVDNIENMYQKLLDCGATPHEEPREVGGGIIVATVKDPWNNVVGIIYNPHFQVKG